MDEIYNLKPESIFDVADESVFFERKDIEHKGYINSGNCYELYYAISKYYNPDTILEIGTRNGYSLYSMMLGSNVLSKVVGYDKDMDCTVVREIIYLLMCLLVFNLKLEMKTVKLYLS